MPHVRSPNLARPGHVQGKLGTPQPSCNQDVDLERTVTLSMPATPPPRTHHSSPDDTSNVPSLLPSALPKGRYPPPDPAPPDSVSVDETQPPDQGGYTPAFSPFFTLVEDVHDPNQHYHHPEVHYIFSDDDQEAIIDACLRAHDTFSSSAINHAPVNAARDRAQAQDLAGNPANLSERSILVDLAPDGRSVASAHSLSGEWQVLNATIDPAPTLEGSEAAGGEGAMMLKIGGRGTLARVKGNGAGAAEGVGLEGLIDTFRERMEELKRVVERGEALGPGRQET
jgi:hypothetical protein